MALCLYPCVICRWWAPRGFSGREWLLHLPCRRVSCCVTDGFRGRWPATHVTSFLPHFPGETSMDSSPGRWYVPLPIVLGLIAHCDQIVLPRTTSHCLTEEPQRQCLAWFIEPGSSVTSDWLQPSVELSHPNSPAGPSLPASGLTDIPPLCLDLVVPLLESLCLSLHLSKLCCSCQGRAWFPPTPWRPTVGSLTSELITLLCCSFSFHVFAPNLQADCTFFFGKNWASVLLIRNPSSAWHMVVDTQMLVLVHPVFPRWVFRDLFFLEGFHGDLSYSHPDLYSFFSGWSLNRDALLTRWWSFPSTTPSELKPSPTSSTKVCLWSLGACYPSYWVDTAATCNDYMME